ncbi:MAG: glycosyltransferase family 2 protein [Calothrix sp. C42_A2020_038]|nr:glycosyltransferase family 2 protein [Calothrix sp. C42_A2020_038]
MNMCKPKLSIGIPVYNGEKFLAFSLDSLLSQTFQDFEIIISDNASTDRTEDICKEYLNKDRRIRYYRNPVNIGCARNFNRVFDLSSGEYFKWASYDDLHDSTFLMKCIEVLDSDPSIILCHSQTHFIDENGQFIGDYNIYLNADSSKPHHRFHELLVRHFCYQCYGVIRRSVLLATPPMGGYGAADAIFLLRLGLLGKFHEIPEPLFFARNHSQQSLTMFWKEHMIFQCNNSQSSIQMLPDFHAYTVWFDSANKGKIIYPHWRIFWEYLRSAWMGKMNFYQRLCCHISIINRFRGGELLLVKDLFIAFQAIVKSIPRLSISIKVEWHTPSIT